MKCLGAMAGKMQGAGVVLYQYKLEFHGVGEQVKKACFGTVARSTEIIGFLPGLLGMCVCV